MPTWSVRCRHDACRHRRVSKTHPDDYKVVPACSVCGNRKGWRVEQRTFRKNQTRCNCEGPQIGQEHGKHYPHGIDHPLCDQHPHGIYNQARAKGVVHEDIPEEYWPCTK